MCSDGNNAVLIMNCIWPWDTLELIYVKKNTANNIEEQNSRIANLLACMIYIMNSCSHVILFGWQDIYIYIYIHNIYVYIYICILNIYVYMRKIIMVNTVFQQGWTYLQNQ